MKACRPGAIAANLANSHSGGVASFLIASADMFCATHPPYCASFSIAYEERDFSIEYLQGLGTMVVLSVATSDNPYTVFLDEPIPAAAQVGLTYFTMKNPSLYLRSPGKISVLNSRDEVQGAKSLSPFFYTPTSLAKYLNDNFKASPSFNVTFDYDPNTGVITLKNPDSLKLKFSPSFVDFLDVPGIVESDATISNLKARSAMCVHCDLVEPARNLLNGKKSNLLVLFQGFNPYFSQMTYHSSNRSDFRDA